MRFERLRWLRATFSRWFRRRRQEAALDAELRFHFDQLVAEFRADGMSEDEARLAARREFGATSVYREEIRDAWRPPALTELGRTIRFAARSLARTPGFTLLAILTLALGVGANTAMFSVINAVMLEPLPYPDPGRVDEIHRVNATDPEGAIAPADFLDLRTHAAAYGEIAAFAYGDVSLAEAGQPPDLVPSVRVTANFFGTLGMQPQLGRDFRPREEQFGDHRVVLLSHRVWLNRYGGNDGVLGRTIRVNGEPHLIVGVLPESFNDWRHLGWVDVFRPLGLTPEEAAERGAPLLQVIGRRSAHVNVADGEQFIAAFGRRLAADFPAVHAGSSWRTVRLEDRKMGAAGGLAAAMMIGLSGCVLLIACWNLANFLLARTMARARECAVRSALGASRAQLLRPLIAESLLLALAGAASAIPVVVGITHWFSLRSTADNGERVNFPLDGAVFGWALLASLATALAFGIAPALFTLRLNLNAALKSGGRTASGGRGQQRLRHALIVGQIALAMALLAAAGLLIRGIHDLNHRRQGWDADALVTGTFLLPSAEYPDPERIREFQQRVLERLERLPGVSSASLSYFAPFLAWYDPRHYVVQGREPPEPGQEPAALVNGVTPAYFDTVGTPVVSGRAFTAHDDARAPRVFIINEAMAAALFGSESPLGKRLVPGGAPDSAAGEIVGVARDVKSIFADATIVPFQLYQPMAQEPRPLHELAVRVSGLPPASLVPTIRALMTELDPDLPVRDLKPGAERIARANYQINILRDILAAFAGLGLGLATMGIYGVITRLTALRAGEFGIRLALGARWRDITRLVLGSGVRLALIGALLGLIGAVGVTKLLGAAFPNMRLDGTLVLAGATLLLVAVALLACYLPARKAARIDPATVLRAE